MASTQEKKLIFALFFSIIFLHFILLLLSQQAADNTSGHSPSGSLNRPLSFFRSLFLSARSVVFAIRGLINSPSHCVLKRNFSFGPKVGMMSSLYSFRPELRDVFIYFICYISRICYICIREMSHFHNF